jgi:hypothetical protein
MDTESLLKESPVIKIDKEGGWYYNNLPIINRAIYLFLNQHIEKKNNGTYIIKVGEEVCPLEVEDTPYVVTGIDVINADSDKGEFLKVVLNDETEEILDLETFHIGNANVPYCTVKQGMFPARFLRPAYYQFAQHVLQEEERFYILLNKEKYYIS